ncbi:hypothetical protein C0993_010701 [Termitomyces sp. T159_Od127]|nr:hypothetical protein C0993_010701 [Termitomyces sp. T159_Od127]
MKEAQADKPVLPKVPIPVEESRAQRLQRSQARFRDRGGIFVPTARNTLVDILLGRKVASPKKGRGRSASLSPRKKGAKSVLRENEEEVKAVRTSPRKSAHRQELQAGPSSAQCMVLKHETTKKSKKEVLAPAIAISKAKIQGGSEKPAAKKRGRKPKTVVQDVEHPEESSPENAITKGKGKKKAPTTKQVDEPHVTPVEALPKSRKKRARPVDPEIECSSPSKRVKQTPLEETKPKARRKKAPAAKDTSESNEEPIVTKCKDALSKSPPKKRARETDDERPAANCKKTKGTVDVSLSSDGAVDKKAEKTKKPSTSKTPRAKKGRIKAPNQGKARAATNTESGELIIPRVRPRKGIMIRKKDPEPHHFLDDDPDPIDFLT